MIEARPLEPPQRRRCERVWKCCWHASRFPQACISGDLREVYSYCTDVFATVLALCSCWISESLPRAALQHVTPRQNACTYELPHSRYGNVAWLRSCGRGIASRHADARGTICVCLYICSCLPCQVKKLYLTKAVHSAYLLA